MTAEIRGFLTGEQVDRLVDAGYEVHEISSGEGDLLDVGVSVDMEIPDLLSPPLCTQCWLPMEPVHDEIDQDEHSKLYICQSCGAAEMRIPGSPK